MSSMLWDKSAVFVILVSFMEHPPSTHHDQTQMSFKCSPDPRRKPCVCLVGKSFFSPCVVVWRQRERKQLIPKEKKDRAETEGEMDYVQQISINGIAVVVVVGGGGRNNGGNANRHSISSSPNSLNHSPANCIILLILLVSCHVFRSVSVWSSQRKVEYDL